MKVRKAILIAALATLALVNVVRLSRRPQIFSVLDPKKEQSFLIHNYLWASLLTIHVTGNLDGVGNVFVVNKGRMSAVAEASVGPGTIDKTFTHGAVQSPQELTFYPKTAKNGELKITCTWN